MYKCESITKIESINQTDVLEVRLVNQESVLDARTVIWFYDYTEALKYVGQNVFAEFRQEMYNGNIVEVINTFTIPTQVNTLDKKTDVKLYAEVEDNYATCSFYDINEGEELPSAVLYCIAQQIKSSQKSTWMELRVRDKLFHIRTLRLFGYNNMYDYAGHYIFVTPLTRTKYGFQCEEVREATGEVPENPEITIAAETILQIIGDRLNLRQTIANAKLFEKLKEDIDYELGYRIVRLAIELTLTESFYNITPSLDIDSIQSALIADAIAYTRPESVWSHTVKSCILASKGDYKNRKLVCQILDNVEEDFGERRIFHQVKDLAEAIIRQRKGDDTYYEN